MPNLKPIIGPGGSDGEVQFNDDGVFGGEATFFWDAANNRLGVGTIIPSTNVEIQSSTTGTLTLSTSKVSVVNSNILGRINFQAPLESGGGDAILVGASIHAEADDTFAADNNSTELVFSTATTSAVIERLRITNDGLIGIGTAFPGKLVELSLDSVAGVGDLDTGPVFRLNNTLNSSIWGDGGEEQTHAIEFYNDDDSSGGNMVKASIRILNDRNSTAPHSAMAFSTATGTAAEAERVRISDAGLVGIGTSAPGSLLELQAAAGAILTLSTSETEVVSGDIIGRIDFQAPLEASGTDAILVGASIYAKAEDIFAADNNETALVFETATSGATSERMRIDRFGRVGINDTTPDAMLDITTLSATQVGQIIQATAAQSADLFRITDSAAAIMFLVDEVGHFGIGNATEGGTGRLNRLTTHEAHTLTLGPTSDTTTISIPVGSRLLGVGMNVNTAVTDDDGNDTWTAAFINGSTTTIVTGAAAAQNTKVDFMVPDEITVVGGGGATQIQFTPNGTNFTAGIIEIVAYYEELTSLANV